jgi:mannosyltransferase OCH1-like enzyme
MNEILRCPESVVSIDYVPNNIFQTWEKKYMLKSVEDSTNLIKYANKKFNYYLYDNKECRDFIGNKFNNEILETYDKLIPNAYKADLWRYCILYYYGGIYLDSKYYPINRFNFSQIKEELYCLDNNNNKCNIYNGIMISKPKSIFLYNCINELVYNVKNNIYGNSPLYPTGPEMMKKFLNENELKKSILTISNDYTTIKLNNIDVLKVNENYRQEQSEISHISPHYSVLWNNKNIYLQ